MTPEQKSALQHLVDVGKEVPAGHRIVLVEVWTDGHDGHRYLDHKVRLDTTHLAAMATLDVESLGK